MTTTTEKIALFRDDAPWGYDYDGRTGKIQCLLCARRFHGWAGTTNHGRMHVRNGDATMEIDQKKHRKKKFRLKFRFWMKTEARWGAMPVARRADT